MKEAIKVRDEWLALRCQADVPNAFEDLISEMQKPLFYYAAKLLGSQDAALDTLQDAWVRALQGIKKLKEPSSVRNWLYTIVHGIAVDRIRRNVSREQVEEVLAEPFEEAAEVCFTPDDAAAVHHALDGLEPKHREVLVLHFLEDFSIEEIAAILHCPAGTVKSRLYYAKRAIKAVLSGGIHVH